MHPWNPNTKSTGLPGIEPRLLRQTVPVGAHCVSANWATEAGRSGDVSRPIFDGLSLGLEGSSLRLVSMFLVSVSRSIDIRRASFCSVCHI